MDDDVKHLQGLPEQPLGTPELRGHDVSQDRTTPVSSATVCPHCGRNPTGPFPRPRQKFCCIRARIADTRSFYAHQDETAHAAHDLTPDQIETLIRRAQQAQRRNRRVLTPEECWAQQGPGYPILGDSDPTPLCNPRTRSPRRPK